jgi:hypothetical protein
MAGFAIGLLLGIAGVRVTQAVTGSLTAASTVGGLLFIAAWVIEDRINHQ